MLPRRLRYVNLGKFFSMSSSKASILDNWKKWQKIHEPHCDNTNNVVHAPSDDGHLSSLIRIIATRSMDSLLTLKVPIKKMHLKMSSAEVVCCK